MSRHSRIVGTISSASDFRKTQILSVHQKQGIDQTQKSN